MSVGGIVLMTVCLANALTIQAHYCPCNYNSEPFAPDKYYESFLPYVDFFSSFPIDYQNNKPFQQGRLSSFPEEFHKKTVEGPKRLGVSNPRNEVKQQEKTGNGKPASDVMQPIMNTGVDQPKINTKTSNDNAAVPLERIEEKDVKKQHGVKETIIEGPTAIEQKITPHNDQHLPPSLLVSYMQLNKQQSRKNSELGSENNAVNLNRTQENKGRITQAVEKKRIEGSSGQEQKEIYESHSRPFEIPSRGEKPFTQTIIQRSPPSHFNYFPPNFIGVEIL